MKSLNILMREVANSKQLNKEQTETLVMRAQAGDISARDAIVLRNMRLIFFHARQLASGPIEIDDLVQVGGS